MQGRNQLLFFRWSQQVKKGHKKSSAEHSPNDGKGMGANLDPGKEGKIQFLGYKRSDQSSYKTKDDGSQAAESPSSSNACPDRTGDGSNQE
jgi:hypothetical protein